MMTAPLTFDVREHFQREYAAKIGATLDESQNYGDRIVGTRRWSLSDATSGSVSNERFVTLIRPVGADNAARFQRWVTYRNADFESMIARPIGWHYYVLMVGLLPDGSLWWSALYDERILAQPDVYQFAERKGSQGRFYRFDPELAKQALIHTYDALKPTADLTRDHYIIETEQAGTIYDDGVEWLGAMWDSAVNYDGQMMAVVTVDLETRRMTARLGRDNLHPNT